MKLFKLVAGLSVFTLAITIYGCSTDQTTGSSEAPASTDSSDMAELPADLGDPANDGENLSAETPANPAGGIALTPENTTIEFVGSHVVEEKPDPNARHGKFAEFEGNAVVEGGLLKSISVEIQANSLDAGDPKLTAHLNNTDFFNTKEYPKILFQTTGIAPADGKLMVTGDLTMLETTKSITFPAKVLVNEGKLNLEAEFEIDRTEWGINFDPAKVEKTVTLSIKVDA